MCFVAPQWIRKSLHIPSSWFWRFSNEFQKERSDKRRVTVPREKQERFKNKDWNIKMLTLQTATKRAKWSRHIWIHCMHINIRLLWFLHLVGLRSGHGPRAVWSHGVRYGLGSHYSVLVWIWDLAYSLQQDHSLFPVYKADNNLKHFWHVSFSIRVRYFIYINTFSPHISSFCISHTVVFWLLIPFFCGSLSVFLRIVSRSDVIYDEAVTTALPEFDPDCYQNGHC